jgi:hypothetical protein
MNIFKNKRFIATTLVFVLVMALAGLSLPAKERRGSTVVVTLIDGSLIKGELLAVKHDFLLVYNHDAGQGKILDLQQVAKVKVLKKSKLGLGLLIGLGVAVGMSVIIQSKTNEYPFVLTFIGIGSLTALIGGLIGAAITGIDKKISLTGVSAQNILFDLEQLKRYAREQ